MKEYNMELNYKYIDEPDENGKPQHLHTLNGVALIGTSTALKILSKPLTWWASGLACEKFGWLNPKFNSQEERQENAYKYFENIKGLTLDEYIKLLDKAYKAHAEKLDDSASKGTDLHASLERFVKWKMRGGDFVPDEKIIPFIEWSDKNVEKFIASEAHCFSAELWTGGITDAVAKLKNGNIAVIDFKSSKEAYTSQFIQAAGYALQIEENGLWDREGKVSKKLDDKIKELIIFPFGGEEIKAYQRSDVDNLKNGFRHTVAIYKLIELNQIIN
jgi:hypothetical protein